MLGPSLCQPETMSSSQTKTQPAVEDRDKPDAWGGARGNNGEMRDGLVICDDLGAIAYLDQAAEYLMGVEARMILGQPLDTVLKPVDRDGRPQDWRWPQAIADGGSPFARQSVSAIPCQMDAGYTLLCKLVRVDSMVAMVLIRPAGRSDRNDPRRLAYLANHDPLTGLPNRAAIREHIDLLHRAARISLRPYAVLLLDLDHFKIINDRFGHASGDQVLTQVARRIPAHIREGDRVGRWGGEEFLCLLPHVDRTRACEIAERIRAGIESSPIEQGERQIRMTTSIGVAAFPEDGDDPDALLAKADQALYEAKRSGRNRIRAPHDRQNDVFALADLIELALREKRLAATYAPILDLASGEPRGEQASAHIMLPGGGVLEAEQFRAAAEQLNLVHRVDHRIIRFAVERCVGRTLELEPIPTMLVAFSADYLRHPDLVADVLDTIRAQCMRCGHLLGEVKPLVVEITHRHLMQDIHEAKQILAPFVEMGLRLAIDDFGYGHSSISYLIELPVELIKIESSLVQRARTEQRVHEMLQGIQSLAADLGVITIADGVDDAETLDMLCGMGIDWGMGRYFLPAAASSTV